MTAEDPLQAFLHREGAYEICTALLGTRRSRQALLSMIALPERTIDRRLNEGEELELIEPIPTTGTERVFGLHEERLSEENRAIVDSLRAYFRLSSNEEESGTELAEIDLHRSAITEQEPPTDPRAVHHVHANTVGGESRFYP